MPLAPKEQVSYSCATRLNTTAYCAYSGRNTDNPCLIHEIVIILRAEQQPDWSMGPYRSLAVQHAKGDSLKSLADVLLLLLLLLLWYRPAVRRLAGYPV